MQKLVWQNSIGDSVDLTSGNYGITEWEGFSNAPLNIQSQQVPFQDGSVFLDALMEQRELSVTLKMQDNGNLENRYRMRRELIHILNPKLGEGYLIYTNNFTSKRIKCVPQIPLFKTHNSNDSGTPEASLAWTACEPYWEDLEETSILIGVNGYAEIENEGDVPAQLKMLWNTSFCKNGRLTNLTQNQFIEYSGTLNNTLHIDTNLGQKKVVEKNMRFNLDNVENFIRDIIFCESIQKFIGVGSNNVYCMSTDGYNWSYYDIDTTELYSICYSDDLNLIVVVGGAGKILTSTNGLNWTERQSGVSVYLNSITYSKQLGLFIAVGSDNTILESADGITWADHTYSDTTIFKFREVKYFYGQGIYIVGDNDTIAVILKSADGVSWTKQTFTPDVGDYHLYSIAYSSFGTFVATGYRLFLISNNGTNWEVISDVNKPSHDVIYNSEFKKFVGCSESAIYVSKNGRDWQNIFSSEDFVYFSCIVYNSTLKIFIVDGQTRVISNDLENWSIEKSYLPNINIYAYNERQNKLLVAISRQRNYYISENNGKSFKSYNLNVNIYNMNYISELNIFVLCGEGGVLSGSRILTSTDGINWEECFYYQRTLEFNNIYYDSVLHKIFVLGTYGSVTSTDGINWDYNRTLYGSIMCRGKDILVIGFYKSIYISTDGINWTLYSNIFNNSISYITYNADLNIFILVGSSGFIATSEDGIIWEQENSNTTSYLTSVKYIKELRLNIIIGFDGTILTSYDSINWSDRSIINLNLYCIWYDVKSEKIVLMGEAGAIIRTYYEDLQNQIQKLTNDSDMNMNLRVGKNAFRINCEEGNMIVNIKYRQKYIGV